MDGDDSSNQENTRDFHLAPKQKERISSQDAFSDVSAPGKYLEDIRKNKVEKLPERIERLFNDIRILAEADFFTEDWDADIWDRVDLTDDEWHSWEWEANLEELLYEQDYDFDSREPPINSSDRKNSDQTTGPMNFGIELGHSLRLLSNSYLSKDERLDLLVGIFIGMMQQDPIRRYSDTEDTVERPLELADEFKQKLRAWTLLDSLSKQSAGSLQTNISIRRNIVYVCIESAGLTPSSSLIEHLLDEVDFPPVENEQTDEGRTRAQREVQRHLEELVENTELSRIEELIEAVSKSRTILVSMETNAEDILAEIYSHGGVNYPEIDYDGKNLKTTITLLAGEHELSDSGEYQEWIQRPLIQDVSNDWEPRKWKTTNFGTLVGYIIDTEQSPGWLHDYTLAENQLTTDEIKIIEQALSELEL